MNRRSLVLLILIISASSVVYINHTFHKERMLRYEARPYNERAADLVGDGKYDEGISEANKAIEIYPRYAKAYVNLGAAYIGKGLYDQAIKACKKALRINPDLFEALNDLGVALCNKGKIEDAIKVHRRAVRVSPKDIGVHKNLAFDYLNKGLFDMAEKEFDEARSLGGADVSVLKDNQWNSQIEVFQKRLRVDPNDARASYLLGEIYYELELYDFAIGNFRKSIEIGSRYKGNDYSIAAAYNNLGASYIQKGMFEESIASYKKCIEINSQLHSSRYGLGVAYWRQGKYEDAIQACTQAMQIKAGHTAAQYIKGLCLERKKDYPRAIKEYEEILKNSSSSQTFNIVGCVSLSLARCYVNIGRRERALEQLDNFQKFYSYHDERRNPYNLLWFLSLASSIGVHDRGYKGGVDDIKKFLQSKFAESSTIKEIKNISDSGQRAQELFEAGAVYATSGLNDEAITLLEKSRALGSDYTKATFLIGAAYLQKGLLNKAIDAFYKAIRMDYRDGNLFDTIYDYLFLKE